MGKNVFILGAGASKEGGGPLMAEFLGMARELGESGKLEDIREDVDRVLDAIEKLRIVHFKSIIELDNIEEVFGAFEMGRLMRGMGEYSEDEVAALISSIKRLIVKTLEESIKLQWDGKRAHPPRPYEEFASLIRKLADKRGESISVLTFNYDVGLDYALHFYGIPIDYCLEDSGKGGGVKVLKLHGSLNWGRCTEENCGVTVPWHMSEFFKGRSFGPFLEEGPVRLDIGSKLVSHEHCGKPLHPDSMIVPPTWNKTEYHGSIRNVWAQARTELGQAENIFVIGYSHPGSDAFFKYLFALGSMGRATIRRFWVFDPNEEIRDRYTRIVGTGIQNRFDFFGHRFSEAVASIEDELARTQGDG